MWNITWSNNNNNNNKKSHISQLSGVHEANRREREVGSYPENSIVGEGKILSKVLFLVTGCKALPRTINQVEHPFL